MTHQAGLEAAFDVLWPTQEWNGEEEVCRAVLNATVTAYLAAASSGAGELPRHLIEYATKQRRLHGTCPPGDNTFEDAAAFILRQQAEIAELRGERDRLSNQWAIYRGDLMSATNELDREHARAESAEAEVTRLNAKVEDAGAELAQRDDLLIKAVKFRFSDDLYVDTRGPSSWVVCDRFGSVLNTVGEWELEPLPSSRSDDFIARTRMTFAAAFTLARTTLASLQKGADHVE